MAVSACDTMGRTTGRAHRPGLKPWAVAVLGARCIVRHDMLGLQPAGLMSPYTCDMDMATGSVTADIVTGVGLRSGGRRG
jgi:hypothetical protein